MKKLLFSSVLFSIFITTHAFAADTQYTIESIWQDLDSQGPPSFSIINDFNDSGYAVGRLSQFPGQYGQPFWWHEGSFLPINNPDPNDWGPSGRLGGAFDINNSNQFIGWAEGPLVLGPTNGNVYRETKTFFVDNGDVTYIHDFRGDSIDESGTVYGQGQLSGYGAPVDNDFETTWKGGAFIDPAPNTEVVSHLNASNMTNLKDKLASGYDPFWQELQALYETESGLIVGNGTYGDPNGLVLNRAFFLKPVVTPEPATMLLFGLGGAALASRRLKRKRSARKS